MQAKGLDFPEPVAGGLCYILGPLSALFFLYSRRYRLNPFIRFHAWQSIFFSLGSFLALSLIIGLSLVLPLEYVAWPMFGALAWMLALAFIWFRLILQALAGKEWNLPLAGTMARACR